MRKFAMTGLKILVTASLLWFLFDRISLGPLLTRFAAIDTRLAFLIVALGVLQIGLFALRWQRVGRVCGAPLDLRTNLRLTFIGLFFNQTLPSSIGGDAMRIWLVAKSGVPAARAASSVMVDRFVALIILLGLSVVSLAWFYQLVPSAILRHSLTALLAVAAAAFLFLLAGGRWTASLLERWRLSRPVAVILSDLRSTFVRPSGVIIIGLSLAIHLLSVAIIVLMARALGLDLSLPAGIALVPPVLLVMTIPLTIAGWGLREGAMVVALGQIHMAASDALAISILYGLLQILVSLPGGLLWLIGSHTSPAGAEMAQGVARKR